MLTLLGVLHDVASVTRDRARRGVIKETAWAIADLALQQLALEREREQVQSAMEQFDCVWSDARARSP